MKTKLMSAAVVAAIAATAAFADKVTLQSGSVLVGNAGAIRNGKLEFKTDELGELKIDIEKVFELEAEGDHVVKYLDNTTATKPLRILRGEIVYLEDGELHKVDSETVKATDPEVEKWHGSINLSGSVTRGNTVSESATVEADVNRRWEKDRFTANGGYYFAQSGDSKQSKSKNTSRFEAQAQEDHFWTGEKFYTYVNGKYEVDRIMDLKYRWRFGTGVGYQWLEKEDLGWGKISFNQEVGMSYVFEKYDHEDDDKFGTFRYAHHAAWEVAKVDGLDFVHNFEYLPQVDEWQDNYMIDTDIGLTYAFRANWQLIAKMEWDYKSKVGGDAKHSDIRYILGLGYKW
ncbi:MAG: DUF481 domain-containing protein [Kiritimatiellae bacterium]|nr:DUF481 domain-containing protein [Kiritimatiellia bacterium]